MEDWKIQVAVLWLIDTGVALISSVGQLYLPNAIQQLLTTGVINGIETSPEVLFLLAVLLLVPLLMAFVTFVLQDSVNRWSNIVVGVVFFVIELLELSDLVARPSAAMTLIWLWKTVVPLLIVWYAWKSKH